MALFFFRLYISIYSFPPFRQIISEISEVCKNYLLTSLLIASVRERSRIFAVSHQRNDTYGPKINQASHGSRPRNIAQRNEGGDGRKPNEGI
jgi:hypothetical protein